MKRPPRKTLPRDPAFFVEGYTVRVATIAGPEDPKTRRRVLQLVIHGGGWRIAATPVVVHVGGAPVMPLAVERDGRDLVCLLNEIPPEGAPIVVEQWDLRAESPEPFTRRKLPRSVPTARPRKRVS